MIDQPQQHDSGPGMCLEAKVRERAFTKWKDAGCPEGQSLDFWLAAEQEIVASELPVDTPQSLTTGGHLREQAAPASRG